MKWLRRKKRITAPSVSQLEAEIKRIDDRHRFVGLLRSTIYTLIVVAACAVLVAVLFLPVLRIYGSSMAPELNEGEIVISVKGVKVEQGDVIGLYYGNKVLIKRVIAVGKQWVDLDEDGNVSVDGVVLDEPYIQEKAFGECNIELPYQVPDESYFVMGDNRATSVDSRNTAVGCIASDDIVGKIVFRVWPLNSFGKIGN